LHSLQPALFIPYIFVGSAVLTSAPREHLRATTGTCKASPIQVSSEAATKSPTFVEIIQIHVKKYYIFFAYSEQNSEYCSPLKRGINADNRLNQTKTLLNSSAG